MLILRGEYRNIIVKKLMLLSQRVNKFAKKSLRSEHSAAENKRGECRTALSPPTLFKLSATLGYSSPQMSQLFSSFVSASPPSTGSSLIGRLSASMLVTSAKATSV